MLKRNKSKLIFSLLMFSLLIVFLDPAHSRGTAFNIAQANEDIYPFSSKASARRFESLTHEIRCLVCQNQSLAESNAPLAIDLRNKIYHMVLSNKSDEEIKSFLSDRFGDFILLKPNLNKITFILWSFPLIGLALIFLYIFYETRKKAFLLTSHD